MSAQLGMFGGETPVARHSDPSPSHAAAALITGLSQKQRAVYQFVQRLGPSTDHEWVSAYIERGVLPKQSVSGLRTRRKELERKGLIVNTGEKRKSMGATVPTIVWRAL